MKTQAGTLKHRTRAPRRYLDYYYTHLLISKFTAAENTGHQEVLWKVVRLYG